VDEPYSPSRRSNMSRSVRIAAILIVSALILAGIRIAVSVAHRPTDETLIQQALTDSLEASRKGEPGAVMDLISKQLKVNEQSYSDSPQIAKFIKESKPDITIQDRKTLITGDEARIVSPVEIKLSMLGQSMDQSIDNVTLIFHREEARGFLFLPVVKWRLTEVRLPENQLPNASG
jgi:hypothetical protein